MTVHVARTVAEAHLLMDIAGCDPQRSHRLTARQGQFIHEYTTVREGQDVHFQFLIREPHAPVGSLGSGTSACLGVGQLLSHARELADTVSSEPRLLPKHEREAHGSRLTACIEIAEQAHMLYGGQELPPPSSFKTRSGRHWFEAHAAGNTAPRLSAWIDGLRRLEAVYDAPFRLVARSPLEVRMYLYAHGLTLMGSEKDNLGMKVFARTEKGQTRTLQFAPIPDLPGWGAGRSRILSDRDFETLASRMLVRCPPTPAGLSRSVVNATLRDLFVAQQALEQVTEPDAHTDMLLDEVKTRAASHQQGVPFSAPSTGPEQLAPLPEYTAVEPLLRITDHEGATLLQDAHGGLAWVNETTRRTLTGVEAVRTFGRLAFSPTPSQVDALTRLFRPGARLEDTIAALTQQGVTVTTLMTLGGPGQDVHALHLRIRASNTRECLVWCWTHEGQLVGCRLINGPAGYEHFCHLRDDILPNLRGPLSRTGYEQMVSNLADISADAGEVVQALMNPQTRHATLSELRPSDADIATALGELAPSVTSRIREDWAQNAEAQLFDSIDRLAVAAAPAGVLDSPNLFSLRFPHSWFALSTKLPKQVVSATWVAGSGENQRRGDGLAWVNNHWAWFPNLPEMMHTESP